MLQITPHHRLLLAIVPVDFRRGIDGLAAICRQVLEEDPFNRSIFVFTNRSSTSLKILLYDGNGFWLSQKRFSSGRLAWWPSQQETQSFSLKPSQLHILFSQGNPLEAHLPSDWRPLPHISVTPSRLRPPSLGHPG